MSGVITRSRNTPVKKVQNPAQKEEEEKEDEKQEPPKPRDFKIQLTLLLPFTGGFQELADLKTHIEIASFFKQASLKTGFHKTLYIASFFRGALLKWYQSIQEKKPSLLKNYDGFLAELDEIYPDDSEQAMSELRLRNLRQTKSASDYTAEFDALTRALGWNDTARKAAFYASLKGSVKDRLAEIDTDLDTYDEVKSAAIKIDQRMYKREWEKRVERGPLPQCPQFMSTPPPSSPYQTVPPSGTAHGPITAAQKMHRRENNLCMYCGKPGHIAKKCPAKKSRVAATATTPSTDKLPKNILLQ
jgi:hypothetical protein